MTLRIRLAVLAAALTVGFTGQAAAHAHLKAATPAMDGSVATPPAELDLGFSEGVNPKFTGATVKASDGATVPTGPARLGPGGDATLVVPLTGTLAPGRYRVDWHALAVDGHKTAGSYTFTVAP